jgi:phage baseplate assembly protein gpV
MANLTITAASTPAADTVSVTRAEYDSAKHQLRVDAGSSGTGATLRAYLTGTDTVIGTLSGGSGQFAVAAAPQSITVRSSLGGSATRTVTVR